MNLDLWLFGEEPFLGKPLCETSYTFSGKSSEVKFKKIVRTNKKSKRTKTQLTQLNCKQQHKSSRQRRLICDRDRQQRLNLKKLTRQPGFYQRCTVNSDFDGAQFEISLHLPKNYNEFLRMSNP